MNLRTKVLMLTLLLCLPVLAQKRFVVIDVDTDLPIGGVNVENSTHKTVTTDSLGRFEVPDSCRSLVFTHVSYEPRIVNTDELSSDTILLISKLLMTREVYVLGNKKRREDYSELNKSLRLKKQEAQLLNADPNSGFNVLPLLSKLFKSKKKKSRKERLKEILDNY